MTDWHDDDLQQDPPSSSSGKLLMLFFIAVIAAAIAIGLGYTMGKHSGPPDAQGSSPSTTPTPVSGAAKPGAGHESEATPAPMAEASPSPVPAMEMPAQPSPSPKEAAKPAAQAKGTPAPAKSQPELAGKGIMVQVAALTRQDDAETLAGSLRKKQYPVLILPPAGGDKFYHVQVGPFAEVKDAEAMKSKLVADGYNAIVKK